MNRNRIRIRLSLLLAALLAFSVSVFRVPGAFSITFTEETTGASKSYETGVYLLDSAMNFRASPAPDGALLGVIPEGTVVLIDTVDGIWGHTTYQGREGWMSLEYSSVTGDPKSSFSPGKYRTDVSLNFRSSAAELKNNVIGLVPGETVVSVTAVSGFWGKISYRGKDGWISLNYCTPFVPPEEETTQPEQPGPATPLSPAVPAQASVDWLVLDISRHNAVEDFDWPAIREAGVMGVIIRVGGRGVVQHELYDDVSFYRHYLGAKSAGMHVGAYFFSYALTEAEAKEEAQRTIDILRSCKAELDMPVYIDIEDYSESDYEDDQHVRAGKAACSRVVDAFCETVKAAGYYPGVYCNKYFAENLLDESVFEGRSLWLAHYASECGYKKTAVSIWQYGNTGKIAGYSGKNIDVNRCYVNYPAVIAGKMPMSEHVQPIESSPTGLEWIPAAAPGCRENGTAVIAKDGTVYEERILNAGHAAETEYVSVGTDQTLQAGQTFRLTPLPEGCYRKGEEAYDGAAEQAERTGGCFFSCCGACGEILKIRYAGPSDCPHEFREETVSPAACGNEGIARSVCAKCGFTGGETVLKRTAHLPEEIRYCEGTGEERPCYGQFCAVCRERLYASYDFIRGDVDGDLKVDSGDARLALRHATRLETIGYIYQKNADYNGDGTIDPADARLILRKSVNLE